MHLGTLEEIKSLNVTNLGALRLGQNSKTRSLQIDMGIQNTAKVVEQQ